MSADGELKFIPVWRSENFLTEFSRELRTLKIGELARGEVTNGSVFNEADLGGHTEHGFVRVSKHGAVAVQGLGLAEEDEEDDGARHRAFDYKKEIARRRRLRQPISTIPAFIASVTKLEIEQLRDVFQEIIGLLREADEINLQYLQIAQDEENSQKSHMVWFSEDAQNEEYEKEMDIVENLFKRLLKLQVGKILVIPGGIRVRWCDMFYVVTRTTERTFSFTVCNATDSAKYHAVRFHQSLEHKCTFTVKDIPEERFAWAAAAPCRRLNLPLTRAIATSIGSSIGRSSSRSCRPRGPSNPCSSTTTCCPSSWASSQPIESRSAKARMVMTRTSGKKRLLIRRLRNGSRA
eukprot:scaffold1875_cov253-Pinguiococcus_pyrenoidosus.AAC.31